MIKLELDVEIPAPAIGRGEDSKVRMLFCDNVLDVRNGAV